MRTIAELQARLTEYQARYVQRCADIDRELAWIIRMDATLLTDAETMQATYPVEPTPATLALDT